MSNEAQIISSLTIKKGKLFYQSNPTAVLADVSVAKGPSPGAITAALAGTDVDFGELTAPGLCRLMNLDDTNFVEYGIREPASGFFYPLGELLPGESFILRLSRNLQEEYTGVGTGTSAPTNFFHLKANTAPVVVLVEAFEK